MSEHSSRVAVIGAGPSGLAMTKELHEHGIEADCFDAGPGIGGVFADGWEDLQLTSSTLLTPFSDFGDDADEPRIWTAEEYVAYLRRYVDHFGFGDRIRPRTRVEAVRPVEDGLEVTVRAPEGEHRLRYGHVAVCTGQNQTPRRPEFEGEGDFEGEILHSSAYRSAERFAGRRVLVVGAGESGSDISLLVARVAAGTALSIRGKHGYLLPRFLVGNPTDIETARSHHAFPIAWGDVYYRLRFLSLYGLIASYRLFGTPEQRTEAPVLQRWADLQRRQHPNALTRFGTKNLSMVEAVLHHGCTIRPGVARLDHRGAIFTDGTRFDCDAVICATGYRNAFPFLEEGLAPYVADLQRSSSLYRHCVHPDIGARLFFCGFARPALGALPPISELQARWFAQLVTGGLTLPSAEAMRAEAAADRRRNAARFGDDVDRITTLVDYLEYLDALAEQLGCAPPLAELRRTDRALWRQIVLGPIHTAQYRLRGPGAKPELARELLLRLPVARTSLDVVVLEILGRLSRLPGLGALAPTAAWR